MRACKDWTYFQCDQVFCKESDPDRFCAQPPKWRMPLSAVCDMRMGLFVSEYPFIVSLCPDHRLMRSYLGPIWFFIVSNEDVLTCQKFVVKDLLHRGDHDCSKNSILPLDIHSYTVALDMAFVWLIDLH